MMKSSKAEKHNTCLPIAGLVSPNYPHHDLNEGLF